MPTRSDFANLDRHTFRVAHGSLIDSPLQPAPNSLVWIATMWADTQQPTGWGRLQWNRHPSGRGHTIHPMTHLSDVIEFGADTANNPDRWYGYLTHATDTYLEIVGPFAHPADAAEDAAAALRQW